MVLCKVEVFYHGNVMYTERYIHLQVLAELPNEVPAILAGKHGLKYAGFELEAMAAVAKAAKERSLEKFQEAVIITC